MVAIGGPQETNAMICQLGSGLKPLFPQGSLRAILFGSGETYTFKMIKAPDEPVKFE